MSAIQDDFDQKSVDNVVLADAEDVPASALEFGMLYQISKILVELGLLYSEPFYWSSEAVVRSLFTPITPSSYDNLDNRVAEVARRVLTVAFNAIAFPITALGFLLGGVIQMAGDLISDQPFIYIKGNAPESWNEDKHTLFTLNVCMYWGLLPLLFGGVSPARNRLDPLERLIRTQDPDIVVLQEMSSSSGKRLAARLNDKYAHFFTHIGGNGTWINSGTIGAELFVASKAPIVSVKFVPYEDQNAARKLGFFCIETPSSWVITAHFPDQTEETWQTHRNLLTQIANTIDELKMTTGKSCFVLGDLNIRRTGMPDDEYSQSGISAYFHDPRTEQYPEFSADNATCTNVLVPRMFGQTDPIDNPYETDDYVLIDKGSKDLYHLDVEMGKETYDLDHPDQALTDHRYYKATVYRNPPRS